MLNRLLTLTCFAISAFSIADPQATERKPVGTTEGLMGKKPIYALCTSPQAGRRGLGSTIILPKGVEPACGQKRVKAHVEWAWGGSPHTAILHAYWVKDDKPLREIERQLKANGWKLDGRWPSKQAEQVRYVKPGQELTLQYDNPAYFFYPDYKREGRFLEMSLRRF